MADISRKGNAARYAALGGIMAASLECAKLALAVIPNVEVVTLLLALYGYVFGGVGIAAAFVFVCIEPMIWGFGTWMISYFIHWPLVAFCFLMLGKARLKNRFLMTAVALALTAAFGVLTSLVDIGLFTGNFERFWYRFGIYYVRGIPFYLIQLACNAVLFPLLFPTLSSVLGKAKKRIFKIKG